MDARLEPPKTPPNRFPNPPTPQEKTPPPRISCDINTRDPQGPLYWEYRDKSPDFEVPPLKLGDFKERPTLEEWADKLGYKLPSGESVLSGRPDPSELKSGAKLPPSIKELDRLLKKGDKNSTSSSRIFSTTEPKSKPESFLKSTEGPQEAEQKDPMPSSASSNNSKVQLGAMLPPPPKAPGGLQKKADEAIAKRSFEKSDKSKQEVGAMSQCLFKGAARLQEMADMASPQQAEEDRAKVFMDRLSHVQAASRRLQSQLGIHGDETWPLPPLPDDRNPFIVEMNAIKIRAALDNCKDFAVNTDRESGRLQFLDVAATFGQKRVVMQAGQAPKIRLTSFEDDQKAREAQRSNAIARLMNEGRQKELKALEDEDLSEVPSSPESLFHSIGPSLAPTTPRRCQGSITAVSEGGDLLCAHHASQGGSSVNTAGVERREQWETSSRDLSHWGIGSHGWPEYDRSPTPDSAERSHTSGATSELVDREHATPNSHNDSDRNSIPYNMRIVSSEEREMRTSSHETEYETETSSAAPGGIPAAVTPPSRGLEALSVQDSEREGTQSTIDEAIAILNTKGNDQGREKSLNMADSTPYASQTQQNGTGQQIISDFHNIYIDDGEERYGMMTGSGGKEIDVAASLRNHAATYIEETQLKDKERNPTVPRPEMMPHTLTEAICNYIPLEAKSILTLTLERVDPPVTSPTNQRCILLKHFEVGLDGIEGLCQGTAKIPETPEVTAERERRVGKLGMFKQGDGGFYRSLRSAQQKDQQYGKGYWYFFGVKFKQTSRERKLRRGGKWLLFGAPIEAVYHLDIKRSQENMAVLLGGGVDRSGTPIKPFKANFKRTHTLFTRGGLAPMDIWQGGEGWDNGVFKDIRAAMANNGLRVGFLYGDSQTFHPRAWRFPAAGKFQAEKKRKQAGPDMTEEETRVMEESMKPKKLSDEDIGTILAMSVINDRAKQNAAGRS